MTLPLFQVDTFTARPFAGNPAAVCWLEHEADAAWMQQLAAEMNLSETAFVRPMARGAEEVFSSLRVADRSQTIGMPAVQDSAPLLSGSGAYVH